MKSIVPYLIFDGNGREAMELYAKVFEAHLDLVDASQMPNCPEANKHKLMHARLHSGTVELMASDNLSDRPNMMGNNVWVSVDCASSAEQERFFSMLSDSGEVGMPLQDTFWGAHFGMLTDRFGVHWMFNLDQSQPASQTTSQTAS